MKALEDVLSKLYLRKKQNSAKASLDNMQLLSSLLQHPEKKLAHVHIAGTNGKGSVATKMAKGLQLSGLKTGLYTSPHIERFNERIQINDVCISNEDAYRLLKNLLEIVEKHSIKATFFEICTLLAFLFFAENQVDIAVIETGIGGRLDATNIIQPKLSIITSVALDHCEILGRTVEAITVEKAGIIKPHVPIVVGPNVPEEIIFKIASQRHAPCYVAKGSFELYDDENSAVAQKALEILDIPGQMIAAAIKARPPCRFEVYKDKGPVALILDVAHNPNGLKRLFSAVHKTYAEKEIRIMCALSQDKDILAALTVLKENGQAFHLTSAHIERSCSPQILSNTLQGMGVKADRIHIDNNVTASLQKAIYEATLQNQVLVVCGTFFIMADVKYWLSSRLVKDKN